MKLIEELRALAEVAPEKHRAVLQAVAERLEEQRMWRQAWLDAENRVEVLTQSLDELRLRNLRKEKERND